MGASIQVLIAVSPLFVFFLHLGPLSFQFFSYGFVEFVDKGVELFKFYLVFLPLESVMGLSLVFQCEDVDFCGSI